MKIQMCSNSLLTFFFLLLVMTWISAEAGAFQPSGKIRGEKPPSGQCNNDADCSIQGKVYSTFKHSPKVTRRNKATLTINSFEKGGDGGGPSECDGKFHSDNTKVVALSTRLFNHKRRCFHDITIFGNGRRVNAKVVDECDSSRGCPNNIVDASKAVWKALGVPKRDWGQLDVEWSDA